MLLAMDWEKVVRTRVPIFGGRSGELCPTVTKILSEKEWVVMEV